MRATAHTGPGHDAGDPGFCEGCPPLTAPEVPATNDLESIPGRDATPDEAFELGRIAGYDEAMREVHGEVPADEGTLWIPTTEEIRDYVEVGGEPRPWESPDGEKDAIRAAAFDRWLAAEIQKARADGEATQREKDAKIAEFLFGHSDDFGDSALTIAAAIRSQEPPTGQEQP